MDDDIPILDPWDPELLDGENSELVALSPRRQVFVEEYLIDLNASQAALRSGFSASAGNILLREPAVAAAINVARAQRASRTKVTQDTVLYEVSMLALSSVEHYVVDVDGNVKPAPGAPAGCMRAIQSVDRTRTDVTGKDGSTKTTWTVKLKLWDKPGPLKILGRHQGLFPDKVELTGKDGGPLEVMRRIERVIVDPQDPTGEGGVC